MKVKVPSIREHEFMPYPAGFGLVFMIIGIASVYAGYADGWWVIIGAATSWALVIMVLISKPAGWALFAGLAPSVAGVFWLVQPYGIPYTGYAWFVIAFGLLWLTGTILVLVRKKGGSQGTVRKASNRLRRQDGVASSWQLFLTGSAFMLRLRAKVLRPCLRLLPLWRRMIVPATELGAPLCRVGVQQVYSSVEDVTAAVGGPRVGKSAFLACRIMDAPGAVIATSTRIDLIDLTAEVRREQKGPTYVYNPSGLGGMESTVTFDPLAGCEDFSTAKRRARDMINAGPAGGGNDADREHWLTLGAKTLSVLMHAAKLAGLSMFEVQDWLADPDEETAKLVNRICQQSKSKAAAVSEARQFFNTNDRTQSSITSTVSPVLEWLSSADAVAATDPTRSLDVAALLEERGTVYMLAEEDGLVAPLVTALTAHLAREARRIAATMPKGRLDPPLTLVLDEAAIICPIPLDRWTADMGGRNITINFAVQGRTQLRQRWGTAGAGTILNNTANLIVYGGTFDEDDLKAYQLLIGERDAETDSVNHSDSSRSTSMRREPIVAASQLASMAKHKVVIIRSVSPPVVGVTEKAWERRVVKKIDNAKDRRDRAAAREARRLEAPTRRPRLVEVSLREGWAGFVTWVGDLRSRLTTPPRLDPTMRTRRIGDTPISPVDYSDDYPFPTDDRRHLVVVPDDENEEDQR